jgi:hypothetical protein
LRLWRRHHNPFHRNFAPAVPGSSSVHYPSHHECSHLVVYSSSSRVLEVRERRIILMTLSCVEAPSPGLGKDSCLLCTWYISSSAFCCVSLYDVVSC